jgi:predicted amidohydrolase YtcJ
MPDLLIRNANIVTLDPRRPRVPALAIHGERLAAVGDEAEVRAAIDAGAVLDLQGQTVVPGFIDSHVHFTWTGVRAFAVDLSPAERVAHVRDLVRERVARTAPGALVFGRGLDFGACPTAADLDELAPDHPVLLQGATGHFAVANRGMLEQLGLQPGDAGLDRHGRLQGAANTRAAWRVPAQFAAEVGWERVFGAGAEAALQAGITTLHALEGEDRAGDPAVLALLRLAPELPVRVVVYYQTTDVEAALRLGLPRIGGCIWIDGDFEPHTAALKQPYADAPDSSGSLYFDDATIQTFVERAHQAGLQIALHCVGDAAVAQILRAYRRALARSPRIDHRHRIEHFEVYDAALLAEARALGVHVAIQPPFDGHFGGIATNARFLGAERAQRADPIRTFVEHGIPIGGGSDCPVTPLSPLYGIHCAVNHSNPHERIAPRRALELFTLDNARLAFEEAEKGSVEVGKLADLTVLREDPLAVDPGRIKDIEVAMTIVGGVVRWQAQPNGG